MAQGIERIMQGDKMLAIIICADYRKDGIEFFTPEDFSQQLAYMNRPAGYTIQPHVHNVVQRVIIIMSLGL